MSFDLHKNFSVSTVATAPSPATSGTSLVVAAGTGASFPTPPFNAVLYPSGSGNSPTSSNAEIVRVTGISTDTLTIVRAQESTTARSVAIGDVIAACISKKTFTDIENGRTPAFDALTDGLIISQTLDPAKTVQNASVTLGGARILTFAGLVAGMSGVLIVKQDGTGGRTLALPVSDTTVSGWATRVVANGGAAPSTKTVVALNSFVAALQNAGIFSKMVSINVFAPDNITAAITPLLVGGGNDPWTNSNFISGDLTINGLVGDGFSKALNTGIIPSTCYPNANSAGLTIYNSTASNGTEVDMGCFDANPNGFQLMVSFSGTFFGDCFYNGGSARISVSNSSWTGFTSLNRTSSSSLVAYKANSGVGHTSIASNANVGGTLPSASIRCLATCNTGSIVSNWSTKRLSFAAVHLGLTSSESSAFFNAIQALRVAFGGGFV